MNLFWYIMLWDSPVHGDDLLFHYQGISNHNFDQNLSTVPDISNAEQLNTAVKHTWVGSLKQD